MLCIGVTVVENIPCNHNFSNEASEASWDAAETPYGFTNSAIIKAIKIALILDQLRRMMGIKKKKNNKGKIWILLWFGTTVFSMHAFKMCIIRQASMTQETSHIWQSEWEFKN